jgi:hypothetical protein
MVTVTACAELWLCGVGGLCICLQMPFVKKLSSWAASAVQRLTNAHANFVGFTFAQRERKAEGGSARVSDSNVILSLHAVML